MFTGEPDAGNLQVRFDEGEWQVRVQRPCRSLLYRSLPVTKNPRVVDSLRTLFTFPLRQLWPQKTHGRQNNPAKTAAVISRRMGVYARGWA